MAAPEPSTGPDALQSFVYDFLTDKTAGFVDIMAAIEDESQPLATLNELNERVAAWGGIVGFVDAHPAVFSVSADGVSLKRGHDGSILPPVWPSPPADGDEEDEEEGSFADDTDASADDRHELEDMAGTLFTWLCPNCTQVNPYPVTPETLEFAGQARAYLNSIQALLESSREDPTAPPLTQAEAIAQVPPLPPHPTPTFTGDCVCESCGVTVDAAGTGGTLCYTLPSPSLASDALTSLGAASTHELLQKNAPKAAPPLPSECTVITYDPRMMLHEEREATDDELLLVHEANVLEVVKDKEGVPDGQCVHFGSDTYANRHTPLAARLSCGGLLEVTSGVVNQGARSGVAIIRPPGHHAEAAHVMGFCLYNNVGVAAQFARKQLGVSRVLIVDWDVHHGNGTQNMFYDDPSVLYFSTHRFDGGRFYPGTGSPREVGAGPGLGYNINIGWNSGGVGDADYIAAFSDVLLPIGRQFDPDLVIISAGFDAAEGDPLGGCAITPIGYAHLTAMLRTLANGKIVVALEGGYNLQSISRSMEAVVKVLLGDPVPRFRAPPDTAGGVQNALPAPKRSALASIQETMLSVAPFWSSIQQRLRATGITVPDPNAVATGSLFPLSAMTSEEDEEEEDGEEGEGGTDGEEEGDHVVYEAVEREEGTAWGDQEEEGEEEEEDGEGEEDDGNGNGQQVQGGEVYEVMDSEDEDESDEGEGEEGSEEEDVAAAARKRVRVEE